MDVDISLIHQAVGPSPSNYLDDSAQYTCKHQKIMFVLSTVIALITIVILYVLEPEMPQGGIGYIRLGWAWHCSGGWQHL
jgi:hypothetical protein